MLNIIETQNIILLNVFTFLKCNFTTLYYLIYMDIIKNLSYGKFDTVYTIKLTFFPCSHVVCSMDVSEEPVT